MFTLTFGEKLKQIRIEKGMSQQDFANLLNTSKQVISRYELGQTTPKIGVAAKMCQILGINLNNMINDEKDIYDSPLDVKDNPTENDEVEEEYLLASRSKDGKRGIEVLTKQNMKPQKPSFRRYAKTPTKIYNLFFCM